MAETKETKETKSTKPKTVKLTAKFGRFVDQVTGKEITTGTLVEMHPWLQAQIDVGHLSVDEE